MSALRGLTKVQKPVEVDGQNGAHVQAAVVQAFFADPRIPRAQKEELMRRYKARNNLLDFITYTMPEYRVNWHHEIMCNELDDFLRSPTRRRLMVFVGPRRGKSEIISRRLPAYAMGLNPDLRVIACSYGAGLAKKMSRATQSVIASKKYRELFPETMLNSSAPKVRGQKRVKALQSSDQFEIVGHNGSYLAAGVDGPITGSGADLAIIDDPHKDWKEATSANRKQDVYDWYLSTFMTRESKHGKTIILMTRWAEDDLCGRLLAEAAKNPDADQWEVISFPEIYDEDNEYAHPLDMRAPGEVLWPAEFSEERVKKIKSTLTDKIWTSLFQQQPKPGDGTVFMGSWFQYFKELPQLDRVVVSWDFNFGENTEKSDYVVGTVWGIKGANKYLLYMIREKLDFLGSLKEMQHVHQMFPKASATIIEGKANGAAIVSVVKKKIPGVLVFMPSSSKVARALAASPQFKAGNIFLPDPYYKLNRERFGWMMKKSETSKTLLDDYVEEFKNFPFGKHDDMVDSSVQMILTEMETPAWLLDVGSSEDRAKMKEQSVHDKMIADIFGWSDQLGTDNTGEDSTVYRLGF